MVILHGTVGKNVDIASRLKSIKKDLKSQSNFYDQEVSEKRREKSLSSLGTVQYCVWVRFV